MYKIVDFRYNPFKDLPEPVQINAEEHTIPLNSPYIIRLTEVPFKENPGTLEIEFATGGNPLEEVSVFPAQGQFWPDYNTYALGDKTWNTGTILFNAADAGKTVKVSYKGLGTLVDARSVLDSILAATADKLRFTTGTIYNGGQIPIPAGFSRSECRYAVWPQFADARSFTYADDTEPDAINKLTVSVNQSNGVVNGSVAGQSWYNTGTELQVGYLCIASKFN